MPNAPVPAATRVQLYPRRKAGAAAVPAKGRLPVELTRGAIEAFFGQPQPTAAQELGISLTALKQVCRRLGVERWPYVRPCKLGGRTRRRRTTAEAVAVPAGLAAPRASRPESTLDLGAPSASSAAAATMASHRQSNGSYQDAASFRSAAQRAAAPWCAYNSDSDDSCVSSAETQVGRTHSAVSEAGTVPCSPLADKADEDKNIVERACHYASPWTPAREGACDALTQACAGTGTIDGGDSLGWLVGCESGDADESLEHAWRCLERSCQAQQGGAERSAYARCASYELPAPEDVFDSMRPLF
jgi:hypothetical protein